MFKKITVKFFVISLLLVGALVPTLTMAAPTKPVNVYLFYGEGCPHCAKEIPFLDYLAKSDVSIRVKKFEVWQNQDNAKLMSRVAASLNVQQGGVPLTIIQNQPLVGFDDALTTGQQIIAIINDARSNNYVDVVSPLMLATNQANDRPVKIVDTNNQTVNATTSNTGKSTESVKKITTWWGQLELSQFSLPVLTIIIGLLDSLNPCALWVLLFLLSLLMNKQDKKRVIWLGGGFIAASAITYFLFLTAWLNIYLLIGMLKWLKMGIVLFALLAGGYSLREWWRERNGGCEIAESEKRKAIIFRLKALAQNNSLVLAFIGVFMLAAAINLVELLCSAGLPAVYVPILTAANLSKAGYYGYLLLYVFCYILDQLVIFFIMLYSQRLTAISSRITRWTPLVSGVLMLLLGLWLLVKWFT
jgi:cytochrome c biogenesis protein CcdA